jgi:hypothetical protein
MPALGVNAMTAFSVYVGRFSVFWWCSDADVGAVLKVILLVSKRQPFKYYNSKLSN